MNKMRTAQVMIETIAAFLLILLLFIGTTKVFVWLASAIAVRSQVYQAQRKVSGSDDTTVKEFVDSTQEKPDFIPRVTP